MQAYSMDLRERGLLDSDAGMKAADVPVKYRVTGSWVLLLKQRRRETGEVAPRVQRCTGGAGRLSATYVTLADAGRGATGSHRSRFDGRSRHAGQFGDDLARGDGSGRDRQKKRSGPPNTIDLTSRMRGSCGTPPLLYLRMRRAWCFSSKRGITNNLLRRNARALRGACVHVHAPFCPVADQYVSRGNMRVTGLTAPGVFDGAIDGASVLAYIGLVQGAVCSGGASGAGIGSGALREAVD